MPPLTTQGSGKYLSAHWLRERQKAMEDKSGFTEAELEYLDITGTDGTSVNQDDTYKIDTNPVDPLTEKKIKAIDTRDLPLRGGK